MSATNIKITARSYRMVKAMLNDMSLSGIAKMEMYEMVADHYGVSRRMVQDINNTKNWREFLKKRKQSRGKFLIHVADKNHIGDNGIKLIYGLVFMMIMLAVYAIVVSVIC